jgi:putative DNA primase/helicase
MIKNHNEIATEILSQYRIITFQDTKEMFYWNSETGLYEPAEILVEQLVQGELKEDCKTHIVTEVKDSIKRQTYISRETVGAKLNYIPIENGVYDFETETLIPYSHEMVFLTKHSIQSMEGEYLGENPIDKFLGEVSENQSYNLLLKEIAGYCFYREMPFQNFFILVGKGCNGKSVYLNILKKMLGEKNISTLTLQTISEGGFELGYLYQKNCNMTGDLPKKAFQDVGHIKELTGGDTITAKQKFKDPFTFKNYAKLIAACNEVPESPDTTDGFFRRAVIINFPNSFEGKANPTLFEDITTPENIWYFFKSCLNAFKQARDNNGWIVNESTEQKRDKYVVYSNSAVAFCGISLEYEPDSNLSSESIFEQYNAYCKKKQVAAKNEVHFFKSLYSFFGNKVFKRRLKESEGISNRRVYVIQGVAWKEEYEADPFTKISLGL